MNLLLLDPRELGDDGRFTLTGRRARHLTRVLGVRPGSQVRAGIVGGGRGTAFVRTARDGCVEAVMTLTEPTPPPRPAVDLVLALPRPKALARALQTAATLGVAHIDLVNAWRVDKSYFRSPALAPEALDHQLRLGCEQGATTWLPTVAVHRLLMPYVREQLAPPDPRTRVALHPTAAAPLECALPRAPAARIVAAIGPEGGWIERELATLADCGFALTRLGASILRTETAIAALLSQLELLRRLGDVAQR
jgi:RsmE family RNA methyltransferase